MTQNTTNWLDQHTGTCVFGTGEWQMLLDQNRIELLRGVSVVCAAGEGWVRGCYRWSVLQVRAGCAAALTVMEPVPGAKWARGGGEKGLRSARPSRDLVSSLQRHSRCYSPGARDQEPGVEK